MHPAIWKASGHLDTFSDPMSMCKSCKKLIRADQIWDIFEDGEVKTSLEGLLGDAGKIANWCKGRGRSAAPNLFAIKQAETQLPKIFERPRNRDRHQGAVCPPGERESEVAVLPCPHCGGE